MDRDLVVVDVPRLQVAGLLAWVLYFDDGELSAKVV